MSPTTKMFLEVAAKAAVAVAAQAVTARLLKAGFDRYDEWASRPAPLPAPEPVEPQPEPAPAAGGAQ